MTDLEILTKAYDQIGIKYTVRKRDEYQYVFLGDRRDIFDMKDGNFVSYEDGDIDRMLVAGDVMEFENGELASY